MGENKNSKKDFSWDEKMDDDATLRKEWEIGGGFRKWVALSEPELTEHAQIRVDEMNELGIQGWELVSVVREVNLDDSYKAYWKRPLEE